MIGYVQPAGGWRAQEDASDGGQKKGGLHGA